MQPVPCAGCQALQRRVREVDPGFTSCPPIRFRGRLPAPTKEVQVRSVRQNEVLLCPPSTPLTHYSGEAHGAARAGRKPGPLLSSTVREKRAPHHEKQPYHRSGLSTQLG